MIRFRLGERFRAALERGSGAAVPAEELLGMEDALGIEVDGVEISGGLLEDPVVPALAALVEAVADLATGASRLARVPFADGSIELFLARRGDEAMLSLVSLHPPARVLVRDLVVELAPLREAARGCARDLLDALAVPARGGPEAGGPRREAGEAAERRARALAHRRRRPGPRPGSPPPTAPAPGGGDGARSPAERLAAAWRRLDRARSWDLALAGGLAPAADDGRAPSGLAEPPPGDRPSDPGDPLRSRPSGPDRSPSDGGGPLPPAPTGAPPDLPLPPVGIGEERPEGGHRIGTLPGPGGARTPPRPRAGPPLLPGADAPAFGFDLRDHDGRLSTWDGGPGLHALLVPGHVYVHGPDGEELLSVPGSPFLVLRNLSREAFRLLRAARDGASSALLSLGDAPPLEVDLAGGALTVAGRTLRCPPEAVAGAAFQAALDFSGAVLARNDRLAENPYLASLAAEAREGLALCRERLGEERPRSRAPAPAAPPRPAGAGRPLARGDLRRVALRLSWRAFLPPLRSAVRVGSTAWLVTDEGVAGLGLEDGVPVPGFPARGRVHLSASGSRSPLLLLDEDGHLEGRRPDGSVAWVREGLSVHELAPRYAKVPRPGGRAVGLVLAEGRILLGLALDTGRTVLRLAPPGVARLAVAPAGPLAAVAADTGMVYALDASRGEPAWSVVLEERPAAVAVSGDRLVVAAEGRDGVVVHGFEARTGARAFRRDLDLSAVGTLLPVRGGVVLAGAGPSGGAVLEVDGDGAPRWRIGPFAGRAPSLARAAGTIYARGQEELRRIDGGETRWSAAVGPGGAPVICRGVVALPGERLALLDAERGRELPTTRLSGELPAADHVLGSPAGILVVADREGETVGLRLAGALAVIPGLRPPPFRFPGP